MIEIECVIIIEHVAAIEQIDIGDLCLIICVRKGPIKVEIKVLLQKAYDDTKAKELNDPTLNLIHPVSDHVNAALSCLLLIFFLLLGHSLFVF